MEDSDAKKKRSWNPFGARAQKKSPTASQKVFGVDLDEVELDEDFGVPIVCRDAIERLRETALETVGLFRIPGSAKQVKMMREDYDTGGGRGVALARDVYAVSSLLKLYLRELPEPLLTYELYDRFVDAQNEKVPLLRLLSLREVISLLPPLNRNALKYLCAFLVVYSDNYERNQMTTSNLAIILGPTLLKPPETYGDDSLSGQLFMETAYATNAIKTMIEEYEFLLGGAERPKFLSAPPAHTESSLCHEEDSIWNQPSAFNVDLGDNAGKRSRANKRRPIHLGAGASFDEMAQAFSGQIAAASNPANIYDSEGEAQCLSDNDESKPHADNTQHLLALIELDEIEEKVQLKRSTEDDNPLLNLKGPEGFQKGGTLPWKQRLAKVEQKARRSSWTPVSHASPAWVPLNGQAKKRKIANMSYDDTDIHVSNPMDPFFLHQFASPYYPFSPRMLNTSKELEELNEKRIRRVKKKQREREKNVSLQQFIEELKAKKTSKVEGEKRNGEGVTTSTTGYCHNGVKFGNVIALLMEEPLSTALANLESKRQDKKRPFDIEAMSPSQLKDEKHAIKKELRSFVDNFRKNHGRMPVQSDKEALRPLYKRYRIINERIEVEMLPKDVQLSVTGVTSSATASRRPRKHSAGNSSSPLPRREVSPRERSSHKGHSGGGGSSRHREYRPHSGRHSSSRHSAEGFSRFYSPKESNLRVPRSTSKPSGLSGVPSSSQKEKEKETTQPRSPRAAQISSEGTTPSPGSSPTKPESKKRNFSGVPKLKLDSDDKRASRFTDGRPKKYATTADSSHLITPRITVSSSRSRDKEKTKTKSEETGKALFMDKEKERDKDKDKEKSKDKDKDNRDSHKEKDKDREKSKDKDRDRKTDDRREKRKSRDKDSKDSHKAEIKDTKSREKSIENASKLPKAGSLIIRPPTTTSKSRGSADLHSPNGLPACGSGGRNKGLFGSLPLHSLHKADQLPSTHSAPPLLSPTRHSQHSTPPSSPRSPTSDSLRRVNSARRSSGGLRLELGDEMAASSPGGMSSTVPSASSPLRQLSPRKESSSSRSVYSSYSASIVSPSRRDKTSSSDSISTKRHISSSPHKGSADDKTKLKNNKTHEELVNGKSEDSVQHEHSKVAVTYSTKAHKSLTYSCPLPY